MVPASAVWCRPAPSFSRIVMLLSRKGQTQPEEVNRSAVSDYGHCPYGIAAGKWTLPVRDSDMVYKTKVNCLEIVFI
jgi:hypothetical protein